jgi:hypothetical protein
LPETVAPYREPPFPEKPETLDSTESAINLEKAPKNPTNETEQPAQVAGQPDNYPRLASSPIHATWQAYAVAYHERHKAWPIFNRTVAGLITKLNERVGAKAPETAKFFVERVNSPVVKAKRHPVSWLLKDCESYATEAVLFAQSRERAKQVADTRAIETYENTVAPVAAKPVSDQALAGMNALRALRPGRRAGAAQ